ncbi:MAG TPA: ShlB/FhaC/HecB family hemolysin secretion/activation protein [Candidatus Sulfotelmatobacter sp.]|nr:ShlB/FhaC/HecB family hemolysin secretion/activation protein [Candidatus Sulfotelmatobacter sp.]
MRRFALMLAVALPGALALGAIPRAVAQIVLPESADPLRMLQQVRPQPRVTPSGPVMRLEEPEQAPPPPESESIRFTLATVAVDDATVYSQADLEPLWHDLIGHEISLGQLYGVAAAITRKYRNDGYVLSRAIVPQQRVQNGAVRLEVIEGYVGRVTIQGEVSRESLLRGYADKITAMRPLQVHDLERYLVLMDDLAGTTVSSVLTPLAGEPGASELTINFSQKEVDFFGTADNRGTRYLGPYQGSAGARLNSVLGFYELTQLRLIGTPLDIGQLRAYDLSEAVPIDTEGTMLTVEIDQAWAHPGFTLTPEQVTSAATVTSAMLSHPLIRLRAETLSVQTTFTATDLHTNLFNDTATLLSDRIRSLQWGAVYELADRYSGIDLLDLLLSQGLDVLGARTPGSPNLSRADGRSDFTKLIADAQRVQSLGGHWSLLGALTGQYGFCSLLASEQFGLGGVNYVRAYDPAELTGDSGIAGKLELQYGEKPTGFGLASYQLYTYYDAGRVWNHQALPGEFGAASATAAGAGVRVVVNDQIAGSLEIAKPLTRDVMTEGNKDPRFFFSLVARF